MQPLPGHQPSYGPQRWRPGPPRPCAWCERDQPSAGPGWDTTPRGWRCPACTRAYERDVEQLAATLLLSPDHVLHDRAGHRQHDADEWLDCDAVRQAGLWLRSAESRPWVRERLHELGIAHLIPQR